MERLSRFTLKTDKINYYPTQDQHYTRLQEY
nr:MAG TPA: hypothetical protein [Bacteriophage sp.]